MRGRETPSRASRSGIRAVRSRRKSTAPVEEKAGSHLGPRVKVTSRVSGHVHSRHVQAPQCLVSVACCNPDRFNQGGRGAPDRATGCRVS